jgi:ribosome maturation factor RimP
MRSTPGRAVPALDEHLEAEIAAIAAAAGCELVHAEFKAGILRLTIDRPEGVGLADCELVSKQVSALLDVAEWGDSRYVLEVSSPGLDRPLYQARDYERFTGRLVRVTWYPEGGGKRTDVGRLAEYRPQAAEITVVEEPSGARHEIALRTIASARLEIEL